MRVTKSITALLLFVSVAYAKSPNGYQTCQISQVNFVPCSATSNSKPQSLCSEYTIQSENVVYTIRPRDQNHDLSISIGDRAQFRLDKGSLILRSEGANSKDHPFAVISVSPASDGSTADVCPVRLNHLQ